MKRKFAATGITAKALDHTQQTFRMTFAGEGSETLEIDLPLKGLEIIIGTLHMAFVAAAQGPQGDARSGNYVQRATWPIDNFEVMNSKVPPSVSVFLETGQSYMTGWGLPPALARQLAQALLQQAALAEGLDEAGAKH